LQYKSVKKFITINEPIEYIVFNDSKKWSDITNFGDVTTYQQIINMCKKLNVTCINIPNEHHKKQTNASVRHGDSVNYMTSYIKKYQDKYLILDSDMF
jgi:hypothetical protein